jgi:ketosteroid isomerase-like protein
MRLNEAPNQADVEQTKVRVFGNVAILTGLLHRTRFTHVFLMGNGNCQVISSQQTILQPETSANLIVGTAPICKDWDGGDPQGDDLTVLRVLNSNYVRAFRNADIAWYNAHLSKDYQVIGGTGAISDRAQALTAFAKPVFQNTMESFPVDQVNVRRFGEIALIHARNSYVLKDGRSGVSRYTDIWHSESAGRWRCVAAHITNVPSSA